ncbi:hypothetical protein RCL1_005908 [Eukaryota sp. TZLM3-RCL]
MTSTSTAFLYFLNRFIEGTCTVPPLFSLVQISDGVLISHALKQFLPPSAASSFSLPFINPVSAYERFQNLSHFVFTAKDALHSSGSDCPNFSNTSLKSLAFGSTSKECFSAAHDLLALLIRVAAHSNSNSQLFDLISTFSDNHKKILMEEVQKAFQPITDGIKPGEVFILEEWAVGPRAKLFSSKTKDYRLYSSELEAELNLIKNSKEEAISSEEFNRLELKYNELMIGNQKLIEQLKTKSLENDSLMLRVSDFERLYHDTLSTLEINQSEFSELKRDFERLQDENLKIEQQRHAELAGLNNQVIELQSKLVSLTEERDQMQSRIGDLTGLLNQSNQKSDEFSAEILNLNEIISKLNSELSTLNSDFDSKKNEFHTLQNNLLVLEEESVKQSNLIEMLNTDIAEKLTQISTLSLTISDQSKMIDSLKSQLSDSITSHQSFTSSNFVIPKVISNSEVLNVLITFNNILERSIDLFRNNLEKPDIVNILKQILSVFERIQVVREQEDINKSLESRIQTLSTTIDELNSQISQSKLEIQSKSEEIELLKHSNEDQSITITNQQSIMSELIEQSNQLKNQRDLIESQLTALSLLCEEKSTQVIQLEADLKNLTSNFESEYQKSQDFSAQIVVLSSQLSTLQSDHDAKAQNLIDSHNHESEVFRSKIAEFSLSMDGQSKMIDALQVENSKLKEKMKSLLGQLKEQKSEITSLLNVKTELEVIQSNLESKVSQIEVLENSINEKSLILIDVETDKNLFAQKVDILQVELSEVQSKLIEAQNEVESLGSSLEQQSIKFQELVSSGESLPELIDFKNNHSDCQSKIDDLQSINDLLTKSEILLKNEIEEIRENLIVAQKSRDQLQEKLDQNIATLEETSERSSILAEENISLITKLSTLTPPSGSASGLRRASLDTLETPPPRPPPSLVDGLPILSVPTRPTPGGLNDGNKSESDVSPSRSWSVSPRMFIDDSKSNSEIISKLKQKLADKAKQVMELKLKIKNQSILIKNLQEKIESTDQSLVFDGLEISQKYAKQIRLIEAGNQSLLTVNQSSEKFLVEKQNFYSLEGSGLAESLKFLMKNLAITRASEDLLTCKCNFDTKILPNFVSTLDCNQLFVDGNRLALNSMMSQSSIILANQIPKSTTMPSQNSTVDLFHQGRDTALTARHFLIDYSKIDCLSRHNVTSSGSNMFDNFKLYSEGQEIILNYLLKKFSIVSASQSLSSIFIENLNQKFGSKLFSEELVIDEELLVHVVPEIFTENIEQTSEILVSNISKIEEEDKINQQLIRNNHLEETLSEISNELFQLKQDYQQQLSEFKNVEKLLKQEQSKNQRLIEQKEGADYAATEMSRTVSSMTIEINSLKNKTKTQVENLNQMTAKIKEYEVRVSLLENELQQAQTTISRLSSRKFLCF